MKPEEAINQIEEFMVIDDWSLVYLPDLHDALELAIEALKEQSITHCKDCEYFRTPEKYSYKEPNPYCCRSALVKMSENDFCSKAIKKEGEAE